MVEGGFVSLGGGAPDARPWGRPSMADSAPTPPSNQSLPQYTLLMRFISLPDQFTTISPNIGRGMFAVPDPAAALGLDPTACRPAHG